MPSAGDADARLADAADDVLVQRLQARDQQAVAAVYDRYGARSYGLARRLVGDDVLAQDVVQETFLALWSDAARFDRTRGSLASWILTLTHRRAVDAIRREQRHRSRRGEFDDLIGEPTGAPSVESQAEESTRADAVRAALHRLSGPQREAVVLAYYEGYTQREIATMTDVPLGTVKTRTLSAMRRLQSLLGSTVAEQGESR